MLLLVGCSDSSSSAPVRGEYIFRRSDETLVKIEPVTPSKRPLYPWEEDSLSCYPKITKSFFQCKGSILNPVHLLQKEGEIVRYYDCGGAKKHSLPLRDQKEFIYPILIDLLNYIQTKTGKRVVITSGHCCPDHNLYLDPHPSNQASKHMLGAEVDFYVQGMEEKPEKIIDLILAYYNEQSKYKGLKDFEEFKRYNKQDQKETTPPWYNKEVFVKLLKKHEGRDEDNRHPYPYICMQVRYDWDLDEGVSYSWDKAFHNLHRW